MDAVGAVLFTFGGVQAVYFLWVQLDPRPGRQVRPDESPQLFELLAGLRKALKTP